MATDDMAVANFCMRNALPECTFFPREMRRGAWLYFLRLQFGHLYEGVQAVRAIETTNWLNGYISRLATEAQDAYAMLLRCTCKGTPESQEFERVVGRVRHNTAFHYADAKSCKLIEKSTKVLATKLGDRKAKLTRGMEMSRWRFDIADDILLNALWHEIWNLPTDITEAELKLQATRYTTYAYELSIGLLTFAEHLVCSYCEYWTGC